MKRQEANRLIVKILQQLVEKHPDWRFGQILRNSEAIREFRDPIHDTPIYWLNDFYTEPEQTLEAMAERFPDLFNGLEFAQFLATGKKK